MADGSEWRLPSTVGQNSVSSGAAGEAGGLSERRHLSPEL